MLCGTKVGRSFIHQQRNRRRDIFMDYFLLFLRARTAHSAEMIAASVRAMLQIISIISPIVNGASFLWVPQKILYHKRIPKSTKIDFCIYCRKMKKTGLRKPVFFMPVAGVEPARCRQQRILSPPRLPIPTYRLVRCLLYHVFAGIAIACNEKIHKIRKEPPP